MGNKHFTLHLIYLNPSTLGEALQALPLSQERKHISALFKLLEGVYSGDYKKKLLIVLLNGEWDGFELIMTDLPKSCMSSNKVDFRDVKVSYIINT